MTAQSDDSALGFCSACGSPELHEESVRSAFWNGDQLVVVDDIPAVVCGNCNGQFFDDRTVIMLDLLRGEGYPSEAASGELVVPVFSLRDRANSEDAA